MLWVFATLCDVAGTRITRLRSLLCPVHVLTCDMDSCCDMTVVVRRQHTAIVVATHCNSCCNTLQQLLWHDSCCEKAGRMFTWQLLWVGRAYVWLLDTRHMKPVSLSLFLWWSMSDCLVHVCDMAYPLVDLLTNVSWYVTDCLVGLFPQKNHYLKGSFAGNVL